MNSRRLVLMMPLGHPHYSQQHGMRPRQPPLGQPPRGKDRESTRRTIGVVLYVLGMLIGATLLVVLFLLPPLYSKNPLFEYTAMGVGAALAMPPLVIYLWIPRIVDRFDPEPWWALLMVLMWGAIAACGFSALVNSGVDAVFTEVGGPFVGKIMGACISAPVVEEFTKGLAVFGMFYFGKREFDGVVDGIIYATFAALGFAALENVIYYGDAARREVTMQTEDLLAGTFVIRGILAPWGHPLYTSMTGIGFGIARETDKAWVRWVAPATGYCAAVVLHSAWNTAAVLSKMLFILMIPLWLVTVVAFFGLVLWLVSRKGKIIQQFLEDEVVMGFLTVDEVKLVSSATAGWKAKRWGGAPARKFIEAAARLSLSKWHAARASRGRHQTVSIDFIVPLRQELKLRRAEMSRSLRFALPEPRPWQPGMPPPFPRRK